MNKRPFLIVGLASFLSALVCSYLSLSWVAVCVVLVPTVIGTAAALLHRRVRTGGLWMAVVGTALVVAMLLFKTALTVLPTLAYDGDTVTITARVEEAAVPDEPFLVCVQEGGLPKGTKLMLWSERFAGHPEEGDLVSGEVLLTAAYDRTSEDGRYAKAAGVYLYAWTKQGASLSVEDGDASMTSVQRVIYGLRRYVRDTLEQYLPKVEAGLCRSITIGDRTALSYEVADAFRASGVYHLLAVSGLHLSVVTGAVLKLLEAAKVRRRLRAVLAMAAVILFMALCGFTASVTRAGVMMLLFLASGLFRRRADELNSLGLAAFLMLLIDPFCVWDLGWQLSFASTLGLLTVFPVWQKEVTARCASLSHGAKIAKGLSAAVGVALCAALMTQPLTALYFGEISTVFLLGNLLCVWAGSWLLTVLFAALLVCPVLPPLAGALFVIAEVLCRWLIGCTETLAALPFALLSVKPYITVWLFALVAVLAAAYLKGRMRAVLRATAWMLTALFLMTAVSLCLSRDKVTLTAADTPTPVVMVETSEGCGLIVSGDRQAWDEAQRMLRAHDVWFVDWLLWVPTDDATTPEEGTWSVPIGQLVLSTQVQDAVAFPQAEQTSVLGDGGTLYGGDDVTVEAKAGVFRLMLGEKTVLLCANDAPLGGLPQEWLTPDLAMVCADLPTDVVRIKPQTVVVFCERYAVEAIDGLLPPGVETVYCAESEEELAWMYTR